MLAEIVGFYVFIGLVWACETGYYWYIAPDDDGDRIAGLFAAVLFWPYQVCRGILRKTAGLTFFKEQK
jgi:hypothetical protein